MIIPTAVQFDDKAENYDRFRPPYPWKLVGKIATEMLESAGISATIPEGGDALETIDRATNLKIADIGGGTGFLLGNLSTMFQVTSIEPNEGMNKVAQARFDEMKESVHNASDDEKRANKGLMLSHILQGKSAETGLRSRSMDYITMGNSAHWFHHNCREETLAECRRILKPGGKLFVTFNILEADDAQNQALEILFGQQFKAFSGNGNALFEKDTSPHAKAFMKADNMSAAHEYTDWKLDKDGFIGWAKTHSFVPTELSPTQQQAMDDFFDAHSKEGTIALRFRADLYCGQLQQREKMR